MLALSCSPVNCPETTVIASGTEKTKPKLVYNHSCFWDCSNKGRHTNTNDIGDSRFYDYYRQLPLEMKLHVLSYCGFHVLVNTNLWLRDIDRRHFEKYVLGNPHVTRPSCCQCGSMCDLNIHRSHMDFGIIFPKDRYLVETRSMLNDSEDKYFGHFNRYPSFYYRKCFHFGHVEQRNKCKSEVRPRWRMLRERVTTRAKVKHIETLLNEARKVQTKTRPWVRTTHDRCLPWTLDNPLRISLEPGVYYWEFINHNWEETLKTLGDDRQSHFFLPQSKPSHLKYFDPGKYISLMYRRVVHPNEELDDRFIIVARFRTHHWKWDDCRYTLIHFVFESESEHQENCFPPPNTDKCSCCSDRGCDECCLHYGSPFTYDTKVYKHVFTPTSDIRVFKCVKPTLPKKVSYYCVRVPNSYFLHSLDRNKDTIRLNLYTSVSPYRLPYQSDVTSPYGQALLKAFDSDAKEEIGGYAFLPSSLEERYAQENNKVFKTFCV